MTTDLRSFARKQASKPIKPKSEKKLFTLRIDADVLEWCGDLGPGYQSKMAELLRAYAEAHEGKKAG